MKKLLLVVSLISVLLLTGCNLNNNGSVDVDYENLTQEIAKKDETIRELENQINELKKSNTDVSESNEGLLKDSNKEKMNIIRQLAMKHIPSQEINESYKIEEIMINDIDIYDEAYVSVSHDYWTSKMGMDVEQYLNLTDDDPNSNNAQSKGLGDSTIEAIGTITWTVKYNKEIDHKDVSFAGGGQSRLYKNSLVETYLFYLTKASDGTYNLSLGTGW